MQEKIRKRAAWVLPDGSPLKIDRETRRWFFLNHPDFKRKRYKKAYNLWYYRLSIPDIDFINEILDKQRELEELKQIKIETVVQKNIKQAQRNELKSEVRPPDYW